MDILDALSSYWKGFAQWAGFEEPSREAALAAPVGQPFAEDVQRAEVYRQEAIHLEALAQSYEGQGQAGQADLARFKAQLNRKFAQDTLDFNRQLFSRENMDHAMGTVLTGLCEYQARKEQDHWFVQSLKETLPYRLWEKAFN